MIPTEAKDWILQSLSINKSWQKDKPYEGNVTFQNGIKMQFSMVLDERKCSKMIEILREEIVETAQKLGDTMIKSMPVQLPTAAAETTEVQP